jgi:nitrate/nitrite transport system ATP-binding protein
MTALAKKMDSAPAPLPEPPTPVAQPVGLELRGVAKAYGSGRQRVPVLRDIDLCIHDGEFVAIVGFSGTGKTTLISLMAGLIAPDAGEIAVHGRPVRGPGPDRGVVFAGGGPGVRCRAGG